MIFSFELNEDKVHNLIDNYGVQNQYVCAIEESSEVIKEITKGLRGKMNRDNLAEEISDSIGTLLQICLINGITSEDLQRNIDYKVDRAISKNM